MICDIFTITLTMHLLHHQQIDRFEKQNL